MRAAGSIDEDDLLTTGEAARILGSSRQHVVDLCNQGLLPYTTIGKHRRVHRADVEALRTRTERLTRDQRRSLWLAHAVAGRVVADPVRSLEIARSTLDGMRASARGQARRWIEEWERLLDGPIEELLAELTSRSPKARELRQNSPFAGLLDEETRWGVLSAWRAYEADRR